MLKLETNQFKCKVEYKSTYYVWSGLASKAMRSSLQMQLMGR